MKTIFRKVKRHLTPSLIGILALFVAIFTIIISSQILYNRTVDLLTDNLRERLLTISITAAANVDANELQQLHVEEDWAKPEWRQVVTTLNKAKYSNNDVVFMYIFRKIEGNVGEMEFVADADSIYPYANSGSDISKYIDVNRDGLIEPEGPDKLQWPGQPYPEAVDIPEAFAAYDGPLTSEDLYTDEYGTVLTGYAPIKNDNGEVVAILATDIKADDFFTITTQTLWPFLIFILFLAFIITVLTLIIIYTSRKYTETIKKAADKLQIANNRLKQLDKLKSEFVSIASHQLRSPLTSIRGYASMLLEESYGKLAEKVKTAVERIDESSRFMLTSVEDYLNVSRIEAGNMKYELSNFNLVEEVEHITGDLRQRATEKSLSLEFINNVTGEGIVRADVGKVRQILHNLINNALKYTPKGSVTVHVRDDKKNLYIDIVDTGIGLSKESLSSIFDKFVRAKDANNIDVNGTGLGLFIAQKMAEQMKGSITVSSDGTGKGATFTLELPLKT